MDRPRQFPIRPGTERIALVLQGGGALGAYQVGVYQALEERGFAPNWVGGTSIGAINGALIAGNRPGERLARLERFWDTVARDDLFDLTYASATMRQAHSYWSTMAALLAGRPRFFVPHPFLPFGVGDAGSVDMSSFYDTRPLRDLLLELIDFDYLNSGAVHFSLGAVHVTSGQLRYFDNQFHPIGVEHIMASSALPPGFPAVRVDGELYWDGGICSNTPLAMVLDDYPRVNTLCFMVDLWSARGAEPRSISQAMNRHKEILYASRSEQNIDAYLSLHHLRRIILELYENLPAEKRRDPAMRKLAEWGCHTTMDIVHLGNEAREWELALKDADFSRTAVAERRTLGYTDAASVLELAAWMQPADPLAGVVVHNPPRVEVPGT
jgi:NTE family protein